MKKTPSQILEISNTKQKQKNPTKYHTLGWLKTTGMWCLTVWRLEIPNQGVGRACFL